MSSLQLRLQLPRSVRTPYPQTEEILRNIKKRRSEETRKASTVGASVASAAASVGVKLKRRLRKNTREKQRRLELNDKFDALSDLLPSASGKSKAEKYHILSEAIKLIGSLQQENEDLRQEKLTLVNELNKLSLYVKDQSDDEEPMPMAAGVSSSASSSSSSASTPSSSSSAPVKLEPPPALEYLDSKRNSLSGTKPAESAFPQYSVVAPLPIYPDMSFQSSIDALVGLDMSFPPLPPTPSHTPPPTDIFSSLTGSYAPGVGLTTSIAGPLSSTLLFPHHSHHASLAGDDIDNWMATS